MASSPFSGMNMRNLLLGVTLGLLAVIHSTPINTVTQKSEDDLLQEAATEGFLVGQFVYPSLTTELPQRKTTLQTSQQMSRNSRSPKSEDDALRESVTDRSLTTESPKISTTVQSSLQTPSDSTESDTFEGSAAGETTDKTTTSVFFHHGGERYTTTTESVSHVQSSTTTHNTDSTATDKTESSAAGETTDKTTTSAFFRHGGERHTTTTESVSHVQSSTTTHNTHSSATDMTEGSAAGETTDKSTTSIFLHHGGERYTTTTQSSTSTGDDDKSSSDSSTTLSMGYFSGSGEGDEQHHFAASSTTRAPITIDQSGSGSGMLESSLSSVSNSRSVINVLETLKLPEPVNAEPVQPAPQSPKGHSTPGWIIIVGFIVGVAALVMLCVAIATRDKWNGPNQASQQGVKSNSSNQQREHEMEIFLHKEEPRENGKEGEYTVIPLDELPDNYSSH